MGSESRFPRTDFLTEREIERLMDCARSDGRSGHRDATWPINRNAFVFSDRPDYIFIGRPAEGYEYVRGLL
jgi:hypothetical protein